MITIALVNYWKNFFTFSTFQLIEIKAYHAYKMGLFISLIILNFGILINLKGGNDVSNW